MTGRLQSGSFQAQVGQDTMAPDLMRQTFTVQGMTEIDAYDGSVGWKISPFEGRKDPELLGEDDMRQLVEDGDFYGPLVDYKAKGNRVEFLGHDTVDGDDALKLKVTLKNGDIAYYFLDPETFLEIRVENVRYIRGAVHEDFREPGSYKLSGVVYYPFSLETGSKRKGVVNAAAQLVGTGFPEILVHGASDVADVFDADLEEGFGVEEVVGDVAILERDLQFEGVVAIDGVVAEELDPISLGLVVDKRSVEIAIFDQLAHVVFAQ